MLWGLPIFFGLLVLCAVLYGVMLLRERLEPERSVTCTLELRRRESFSNRVLVSKREKEAYFQIYRTDQGAEIVLSVSKAVYNAVPKDIMGVLVHRGTQFVSFTIDGQTITVLDAERWQAVKDRQP
ncbi:MAG: DUF2500 family protein [Oscillospiraceae bacterium]|nr:DUF2500 family protein [Oscillospiraceae bacterium]